MTIIGVLLALAGIVGFALNYLGIVRVTGALGSPATWAVVGVVGVVVFFISRRPSD
ncbi:MAG: hypothetical protein JXR94_17700 [Candidatus Hydrogenedentes bacterium]|nr:hypothetical protein [Candidatus Hydrogenedentota bacterium]